MNDLTPSNRRSENVLVKAAVVTELGFRNVVRDVFPADFMERGDDATLEHWRERYSSLWRYVTAGVFIEGAAMKAL
jgi:hypothetical protein